MWGAMEGSSIGLTWNILMLGKGKKPSRIILK